MFSDKPLAPVAALAARNEIVQGSEYSPIAAPFIVAQTFVSSIRNESQNLKVVNAIPDLVFPFSTLWIPWGQLRSTATALCLSTSDPSSVAVVSYDKCSLAARTISETFAGVAFLHTATDDSNAAIVSTDL